MILIFGMIIKLMMMTMMMRATLTVKRISVARMMKGDDKSAYCNENCYTSDDLTGLMTTSDWEHQENDADEDAKGIIQHFDTYAYLLSF